MIFSRNRLDPKLSLLELGPFKLQVVKTFKYLGFQINNKLNWSNHIETIVGKCEKSINILKCLTSVWWGGHP